jgi:hypothetical protein
VLHLIEPHGPACHTEHHNCFYNAIQNHPITVISVAQSSACRLSGCATGNA